ncbi:MAG: hypothetical protein HY072_09710 [Deltaproteobacteria bacterium]|nr:hypothetical protein [Deltaproteobacteria bacterium]
MADMGWLADQAKQIHNIFYSLFYSLITVFFLLGIFIEYFKWPLGGMPSFSVLIGRVFIAIFLLETYPEVCNTLANVVDAFSKKLGDLNQFHLVLSKMAEKMSQFSASWVSVKDTIMMIISFITFFLLYVSVHAVDAFLLFSWTLLYVFSPLLIALYVLPATSSATKSLYRSIIEISCWKLVWSVLATLLWSAALGKMNESGQNINFVTAIFFNLMLAGSVLLTPMVVHALTNGGLSSLAGVAGGIVAGATMAAPFRFAQTTRSQVANTLGHAKNAYSGIAKTKSVMSDFISGAAGKINRRLFTDSTTKKKPHPNLKPPAWHAKVPPSTEPPGWMKAKLEREQLKEKSKVPNQIGNKNKP